MCYVPHKTLSEQEIKSDFFFKKGKDKKKSPADSSLACGSMYHLLSTMVMVGLLMDLKSCEKLATLWLMMM